MELMVFPSPNLGLSLKCVGVEAFDTDEVKVFPSPNLGLSLKYNYNCIKAINELASFSVP